MLIDAWCHDRCRQALPTPTLSLRVSKECAQGSDVETNTGTATSIAAQFLRDRLVDLPDREITQSIATLAMTSKKPLDVTAFAADGHRRKTLVVLHVGGKLVDENLIPGGRRRL
jgi:hypothetical protein